MPVISMFYGIIVYLYYVNNRRHKKPHIHVKYQEHEVVISIPANKMKLLTAWIEIHKDELMANWELAVNGQEPFKIDPLR